jgi:hypothetical protein
MKKVAQKFNLESIQLREEKIKAFEDIVEYYIVISQH